MRLDSPWFFLVLALIPFLHRWWMKRNQPVRVKFPFRFPKNLQGAHPLKALFLIKYIALALAVLALARPQTSYRQTERQVSGIDIMLALDVSGSMQIEDLADTSRINVAKKTMEAFIKGRDSDRIGFIMFSGEPLTMAPPTLDYSLLLNALSQANTGILKDGTAIGDGLALAVNRLKDSHAKSRIVILMTDGDNNTGIIDPATAGDLAAGYGIKVYTIAIGREGRVKMPIRQQGLFGQEVTTYQWMDNALNPELLQLIAQKTDGKFYRVQDEGTLQQVFSEINKLERSVVKTNEKVLYDEVYAKPLKLSAALFLFEKAMGRLWWRILP